MSARVILLRATGTIGRAGAREVTERGHALTCIVRPGADTHGLAGADIRHCNVTDTAAPHEAFAGPFDTLNSCLALRTGAPDDAWAIDHRAHSNALAFARQDGISHIILLSAICVQKPRAH